jgi:uncharacterized protein YjiS (DUF1127 family)
MSGGAFPATPHSEPARAGSVWAAARATVSSALSVFVTSVQTARMANALAQLSNEQLARIGIGRHEIFSHAEKLIADGKKR